MADKDPFMLAVFEDYLGNGFNVITAETRQKAREIVDDDNIDLVVLDGTVGLRRGIGSKIPFILMYERGIYGLAAAFRRGADDFFDKTHKMAELEKMVNASLRYEQRNTFH